MHVARGISFFGLLAGWVLGWGTVGAVAAQGEAVQVARAVYAEVNEGLGGFKVQSKHSEDENGYPLDVRVWKAGKAIRKMETVASEDHGSQTTEFYYTAEGELVFAFQVTTTERVDTGEVVNRYEDRFYFSGGELVQWLDAEKKPVSPQSEEFGMQEASVTGLEGQGLALFGAGGGREKIIDQGSVTGTFEGIEQGDYFYLRLRGAGGEEQSYMILQAEGLLNEVAENPELYLGKKLKVNWQERVIFIPEAGGNQQVTVCASVEPL